jgi:hypothetical protein
MNRMVKKGKYCIPFKNEQGVEVIAIISQLRLVDTKRLFKKQEKVGEDIFSVPK